MELTSKKQTAVVAISTVEAEYVALSKGHVMVIHFRNGLESMNQDPEHATVVFEHNTGAVSLSRSAKNHPAHQAHRCKISPCMSGLW